MGATVVSEARLVTPSNFFDPVSVTKDNVKDVIDDGGQSAADVCAGDYAKLCADAGIS